MPPNIFRRGTLTTNIGNLFSVDANRADHPQPSLDDYGEWRGGWKVDFSNFGPGMMYLFGTTYSFGPVDSEELAKVWEVMEKAEAGEVNIPRQSRGSMRRKAISKGLATMLTTFRVFV